MSSENSQLPVVPNLRIAAQSRIGGCRLAALLLCRRPFQQGHGDCERGLHRSSDRLLYQGLLRNADPILNDDNSPCGLASQGPDLPSGGRINRSASSGITLIELLVVVAIIGLMMAITFPTLTTGLDGFRLAGAVDRAGTLFQQARLEADRRQQPVQVTADPRRNELRALAADASWRETVEFKDGLRIVFPAGVQNWMLYPSTPPPQVRLMLEAQTGSQRGFSINIFTGVAEDWKAQQP